MTLTQDQIDDPSITNNATIDQVQKAIDSIDGVNVAYVILENSNGDFLQCAGSDSFFTVELRNFIGEKFKHFVVGNDKKNKSPLKITWTTIECKVGPSHVHDTEVMDKKLVKEIFESFFKTGDISEHLNLRNITKMFL